MSLPAPNLDDRSFQDLVDDAKRFVQQRCPVWSDHNVSDPGVTLIEAFAWMMDIVLFRLNRVTDRHYVKFLELIGVSLYPPTAARVPVTFRLSTTPEDAIRVPAGSVVSTVRTEEEVAISFTTDADLDIVPAATDFIGSMIREGQLRDHSAGMKLAGVSFECFDETPKVGDALYCGFPVAIAGALVELQFECEVGGHGIDPEHPPLQWEAFNGDRWVACRLFSDTTGGLNLSGSVELQVPRQHAMSDVGGTTLGWLRCRVVDREDRPRYRSSPRIRSVAGAVMGGTVDATHGEEVVNDIIGISEGVPAQTFVVSNPPIALAGEEPIVLEVRRPTIDDGDGGEDSERNDDDVTVWEEWRAVPDFSDSGPDDAHFVIDGTTGQVHLGPVVRNADGSLQRFGATPPKGATLRVRRYRTGGGSIGNVAPNTITVLQSPIPLVASVTNLLPALGGVDGESVEEAKVRGPLMLRTRNRAVTVEDFEFLARQAAPEIARIKCSVDSTGADAGAVRVLIVPDAPLYEQRIEFRDLVPDAETGRRIEQFLEERRVIGTRVRIEPPSYLGIKVEAQVRARPTADPARVTQDALRALYRYFNPLVGGPDGTGWPFGRPVQLGEVYGILQSVRGLDFVEAAVVMRTNPITGETFDPQDRIDLAPTNLVFSYEHAVEVL